MLPIIPPFQKEPRPPKLRYTIEEIGGWRELREVLGRDWLESVLRGERATPFRPVGPVELVATLEKLEGSNVLLRAELAPRVATECRRCLGPVELVIPVAFTLNLVPRTKKRAQGRPQGKKDRKEEEEPIEADTEGKLGSFDEAELGEEQFDGRSIDLEPMLREQTLLALPMDALCSEGCLGICPVCGQNLNEARCGCDPHLPDPRWEKLKSLKIN
jgi:uncharacterized protein